MKLPSVWQAPNIEHSFGIPEWYNTEAVCHFRNSGLKVTSSCRDFEIGYHCVQEHDKAQIFLAIRDGYELDDSISNRIFEAVDVAFRDHSINRCEAWVPGWNSYALEVLNLKLKYEGKLPGVVFGFNSRWDMHIYGSIRRQM